jgi:hypothetical protein
VSQRQRDTLPSPRDRTREGAASLDADRDGDARLKLDCNGTGEWACRYVADDSLSNNRGLDMGICSQDTEDMKRSTTF